MDPTAFRSIVNVKKSLPKTNTSAPSLKNHTPEKGPEALVIDFSPFRLSVEEFYLGLERHESPGSVIFIRRTVAECHWP